MMKPIPTFKPATHLMRAGAVALASAAALLAAPAAQADTLSWTGTSYIVSQDRTTGQFQRRGVAVFSSGDVATFTLSGQITSFSPKVMTYNVKMLYTLEDGSTLQQEGSGRNEVTTPPRNLQQGSGRLVGGTGRFEGVSGTTESTGRALSETDGISYFKAEVSLAAKR